VPRTGSTIPRTRNRKIPGAGSPRLPAFNAGRFLTRIEAVDSAGDWNSLHRTQVRNARGQFAGGVGFAWQGLDVAADKIVDFVDRTTNNIDAEMQKIANEMVSYAQANHPWQNRTGNAEGGLQSQVIKQGHDQWTILLGHGADIHYGLWLEVRWGGKYAIILPTLQYFAPRLGDAAVRPGTAN
jgi:hypothetical protein